jgi:hypothetical protein
MVMDAMLLAILRQDTFVLVVVSLVQTSHAMEYAKMDSSEDLTKSVMMAMI